MPCDTVQTTRLQLDKIDPALAAAALSAIGFTSVQTAGRAIRAAGYISGMSGYHTVTVDGATGAINISADLAGKFRQAYSTEIVRRAAGKTGWTMQQTAPGKLTAQRRF